MSVLATLLKDILAQVLSCEYCQIFNIYFEEHRPTAAYDMCLCIHVFDTKGITNMRAL